MEPRFWHDQIGVLPLKKSHMKNLLVLLVFFFSIPARNANCASVRSYKSFGIQDKVQPGEVLNIRNSRRFGLQLSLDGVMGPFPALQADYFITPNFNAELGVGLFTFYAGARWYFGSYAKIRKWSFYTGASYYGLWQELDEPVLYAPVGLQFFAINGLTVAAEVALFYAPSAFNAFGGAFKLGYHFPNRN